MSVLHDVDDNELVTSLARQQRSLVQARFALSMSRLENTASVRVIRKEIARIKTEVRRREMERGLPRDALLAAHPVDHATIRTVSEGAAGGGFLAGVVDKLEQ